MQEEATRYTRRSNMGHRGGFALGHLLQRCATVGGAGDGAENAAAKEEHIRQATVDREVSV